MTTKIETARNRAFRDGQEDSMNALALRIQKPISWGQSPASTPNVGSLGRASNIARTPAKGRGLSRSSERIFAINDFARTGRGGPIEKHEASTTESEVRLTLVDLFVTAFLFMSAASPPVLVWLILRTVY
jgi:hypothetical protein